MSDLTDLLKLRMDGMQPFKREIWIGWGFMPPKGSAVRLDPDRPISARDCAAVAGLDVLLCFAGSAIPYRRLREICGGLLQANPRRLILIDSDFKKQAFLKLGGRN